MFESVVVVDCKNHLLGRLCSTIAKELLNGQHVVLVRCEEAVVSGSLIRRKFEMLRWMNKKMLTNPRKGPPSLSCAIPHALAHYSWHDQAQDCPWCRRHGAPQGLRWLPPAVRQDQEEGHPMVLPY